VKTVTFSLEEDVVAFIESPGWRKSVGMALSIADQVWSFVGARHGVQEREEVGSGFEGWYWRSSVAYPS
jgi:hypothetical protein